MSKEKRRGKQKAPRKDHMKKRSQLAIAQNIEKIFKIVFLA